MTSAVQQPCTLCGKDTSAEHAQNLVHQTVNSNAPIAVADITLSVSEAGTR